MRNKVSIISCSASDRSFLSLSIRQVQGRSIECPVVIRKLTQSDRLRLQATSTLLQDTIFPYSTTFTWYTPASFPKQDTISVDAVPTFHIREVSKRRRIGSEISKGDKCTITWRVLVASKQFLLVFVFDFFCVARHRPTPHSHPTSPYCLVFFRLSCGWRSFFSFVWLFFFSFVSVREEEARERIRPPSFKGGGNP